MFLYPCTDDALTTKHKLLSTAIVYTQGHTNMYTQRLQLVNSYCHVSVFGEIWQQLLHHHVSWPPLQTITHKYVVIPVFNSRLWTKIHSFPFSVQSYLRSWPFCPYPISWCIFSKPSKPCAVAHTEVFLCCCGYVGQRGIFWKREDRNTAQH